MPKYFERSASAAGPFGRPAFLPLAGAAPAPSAAPSAPTAATEPLKKSRRRMELAVRFGDGISGLAPVRDVPGFCGARPGSFRARSTVGRVGQYQRQRREQQLSSPTWTQKRDYGPPRSLAWK